MSEKPAARGFRWFVVIVTGTVVVLWIFNHLFLLLADYGKGQASSGPYDHETGFFMTLIIVVIGIIWLVIVAIATAISWVGYAIWSTALPDTSTANLVALCSLLVLTVALLVRRKPSNNSSSAH